MLAILVLIIMVLTINAAKLHEKNVSETASRSALHVQSDSVCMQAAVWLDVDNPCR